MNWTELKTIETLDEIKNSVSHQKQVLIFKHSTRCSISSMALGRLERSWNEEEMTSVEPYFLDLIQHRDISNKIAEVFEVPHQSPQVILIKDGKAVYDDSHMGISYHAIQQHVG